MDRVPSEEPSSRISSRQRESIWSRMDSIWRSTNRSPLYVASKMSMRSDRFGLAELSAMGIRVAGWQLHCRLAFSPAVGQMFVPACSGKTGKQGKQERFFPPHHTGMAIPVP